MPRIPLPILGPDYASRSRRQNPQRTVNMYLLQGPPGAKGQLALYSCPGLTLHAQVAAVGARSNIVAFDGKGYVVFGDTVYELDGTGASASIGTLKTSGGRVEMVAGRQYLFIVDGTSCYAWDGSTFRDDLETYARAGSELVTNGDFDEDADWTKGPGWTISGGEAAFAKSDLVTNGDFGSDSDWTKGTGWTIGSGTASCDGSQTGASSLAQAIAFEDGDDYVVTFTVSGYSAGNLTPKVADGSGTAVSADGTYTQTITASSGSDLEFEADADFVGSIDDVTVYKAASALSQAISLTDGEDYILEFAVSGYSAGTLTPKVGDGAGTAVSADGFYRQRVTASSGGSLAFEADTDFVGSVDGVSLYVAGELPTGATHTTNLDGYFIVNQPDSDRWYISGIEDPTLWNPLDFATAESSPDDALAVAATHKTLYILGTETVQAYYNSGDADFPFTPYAGGTMQMGIAAAHSLVASTQGLFFLATSKEGGVSVVQVQGMSAVGISDDIAWDLTQLDAVSDADAFVYRWRDRTWYRLNFPTEGRSWEYCVEDRYWIERKSWDIDRHRAAGHGYIAAKHLFADYANGKVYELDEDAFTEDGEILERQRDSQPTHRNDKALVYHAVYLDVQMGVGTLTETDPQVMYSYSDDGGYTWSSELWRSLGELGQYGVRTAVWRMLGKSRQRIHRFRVTDDAAFTLLGAYADVSEAAF